METGQNDEDVVVINNSDNSPIQNFSEQNETNISENPLKLSKQRRALKLYKKKKKLFPFKYYFTRSKGNPRVPSKCCLDMNSNNIESVTCYHGRRIIFPVKMFAGFSDCDDDNSNDSDFNYLSGTTDCEISDEEYGVTDSDITNYENFDRKITDCASTKETTDYKSINSKINNSESTGKSEIADHEINSCRITKCRNTDDQTIDNENTDYKNSDHEDSNSCKTFDNENADHKITDYENTDSEITDYGNTNHKGIDRGSMDYESDASLIRTDYVENGKENNLNEEHNEDGNHDNFCWSCHKTKCNLHCAACPRSFHIKCCRRSLHNDEMKFFCPECLAALHADNSSTRCSLMSRLTLTQLCVCLNHIVDEMKKQESAEIFCSPVDFVKYPEYRNVIIEPMDISVIENNIKNMTYGCLESFLADVKWILHNCIIFNSRNSSLTLTAKELVKLCQREINEIKVCPQCYYNRLVYRENWFIRVCDIPHLPVLVKEKKHVLYPAKLMQTKGRKLEVCYFKTHRRSTINWKDCILYMEGVRKYQFMHPEVRDMCKETDEYIKNLIDKFGTFISFSERVMYNPAKERDFMRIMLPNYILNGANCNISNADNLQCSDHESKFDALKGDDDISSGNMYKDEVEEDEEEEEEISEMKENSYITTVVISSDKNSLSKNNVENCQTEESPVNLNSPNRIISNENSSEPSSYLSQQEVKAESGLDFTVAGYICKNDTFNSTFNNDGGDVIESSDREERSMDFGKQANSVIDKQAVVLENAVNTVNQLNVKSFDIDSDSNRKQCSMWKNEISGNSNVTSLGDGDHIVSSTVHNQMEIGGSVEIDPDHRDNVANRLYSSLNEELRTSGQKIIVKSDDVPQAEKESRTTSELVSDDVSPSNREPVCTEPNDNKDSQYSEHRSECDNSEGELSILEMLVEVSSNDDENSIKRNNSHNATVIEKSQNKADNSNGGFSRQFRKRSSVAITNDADRSVKKGKFFDTTVSSAKLNDNLTISVVNKTNTLPVRSGKNLNSTSDAQSRLTISPVSNKTKLTNSSSTILKELGNRIESSDQTVVDDQYAKCKKCEKTRRYYVQMMRENNRECEMRLAEMRTTTAAQIKYVTGQLRTEYEEEKRRLSEELKRQTWCQNCLEKANFYCCWNTSYCSYVCQKKCWPEHMQRCTHAITQTTVKNKEPPPLYLPTGLSVNCTISKSQSMQRFRKKPQLTYKTKSTVVPVSQRSSEMHYLPGSRIVKNNTLNQENVCSLKNIFNNANSLISLKVNSVPTVNTNTNTNPNSIKTILPTIIVTNNASNPTAASTSSVDVSATARTPSR